MYNYYKLKNKYDSLIGNLLTNSKELLIESFVKYYGEKHRNVIEKRFNEIIFVYYINWHSIDIALNDFILKKENPYDYQDFNNFNNIHSNYLYSLFFTQKNRNNIIGTSDMSIYRNKDVTDKINSVINDINPKCFNFNYGSEDDMNRFVVFPILILNESAIIHEINHSLTRDTLAFVVDDADKKFNVIHKTGLSIYDSEKIIEELLNEKASQEITEIFKSLGGNFSSFCMDIPFLYPYKKNFYLVDRFYDEFKEYIKEARISDNKNALIERIGKDNYKRFVSFINEHYSMDINAMNKDKTEEKLYIDKLIEEMERNLEEQRFLEHNNDYYGYLKELREQIKRINRTDSNDDEFQKKK